MSAGTSGMGDGNPCGDPGMEATLLCCLQRISHFSLLKHMAFLFNNGSGSTLGKGEENLLKAPALWERQGRQGVRMGGVQKPSPGICFGESSRRLPQSGQGPPNLRGLFPAASSGWNVHPGPQCLGALFGEVWRECRASRDPRAGRGCNPNSS